MRALNCVHKTKGKRDAETILHVKVSEYADILTEPRLQWALQR